MSKNPLINALSASGYIILVVSIMTFVSQTQKNKPDTFFAPIVFLSLLTLSVSVIMYQTLSLQKHSLSNLYGHQLQKLHPFAKSSLPPR